MNLLGFILIHQSETSSCCSECDGKPDALWFECVSNVVGVGQEAEVDFKYRLKLQSGGTKQRVLFTKTAKRKSQFPKQKGQLVYEVDMFLKRK